ncbi:MAG: TIR domain-containing protein [Syntrophotalea acetylenica]|nr:TIR domain-containing protein [Syntrophotalea acetylenica]
MAYRNGNYTAFYVDEPFSEGNLGANATRDFVSYNLLRAWKGSDSSFPFNDSHDKNYNVRDGSDWEKTLKPRIRERISNSKNIILFLSSITKNSKALREEIDYGINTKKLPVIVVYPDYSEKSDIINCSSKTIKQQIKNLWDKLPMFRDSMSLVPTLHIPNKKALIRTALENEGFMVNTKKDADIYFYPC